MGWGSRGFPELWSGVEYGIFGVSFGDDRVLRARPLAKGLFVSFPRMLALRVVGIKRGGPSWMFLPQRSTSRQRNTSRVLYFGRFQASGIPIHHMPKSSSSSEAPSSSAGNAPVTPSRPVASAGSGEAVLAPRPRRRAVFDIIRTFGLAGIILAHSDPPEFVFQARNINVPMLMLVAGAVFQLGFARKRPGYWGYLAKRVPRLLVPTYTFFAFYFVIGEWLAPQRFQPDAVVRTLLLMDGVGYVWVIRVYLLVALLAPLLFMFRQRISSAGFLFSLLTLYAGHEAMWVLFEPVRTAAAAELVEFTLFYAVPYGCIFALGLRWPEMSRREAALWGVGCTLVWMGWTGWLYFQGHSAVTWDYKYPPRAIYIWYALGMSHLLYALLYRVQEVPEKFARVLDFVASSTIWIYLWHIMGLHIAKKIEAVLDWGRWDFVLMWSITTAFAVSITYLQKRIVGAVVNSRRCPSLMGQWLRVAFLT